MKKADVRIGDHFIAKVSGHLTVVRIKDHAHPKGWWAVNLKTGRVIRIKSAAKLRRRAGDADIANALWIGGAK